MTIEDGSRFTPGSPGPDAHNTVGLGHKASHGGDSHGPASWQYVGVGSEGQVEAASASHSVSSQYSMTVHT